MTFHIEGRRWFQKTYGNTYHTAYVYKDGELLVRLGPTYGYGEQYLQTAFAWLRENRHIPIGMEYSWQVFKEYLKASYSVIDVGREKDL